MYISIFISGGGVYGLLKYTNKIWEELSPTQDLKYSTFQAKTDSGPTSDLILDRSNGHWSVFVWEAQIWIKPVSLVMTSWAKRKTNKIKNTKSTVSWWWQLVWLEIKIIFSWSSLFLCQTHIWPVEFDVMGKECPILEKWISHHALGLNHQYFSHFAQMLLFQLSLRCSKYQSFKCILFCFVVFYNHSLTAIDRQCLTFPNNIDLYFIC